VLEKDRHMSLARPCVTGLADQCPKQGSWPSIHLLTSADQASADQAPSADQC
jgi:hypothetical protein